MRPPRSLLSVNAFLGRCGFLDRLHFFHDASGVASVPLLATVGVHVDAFGDFVFEFVQRRVADSAGFSFEFHMGLYRPKTLKNRKVNHC